MSRILIIDDEPAICWAFEQALTDGGHEVRSFSTAESALAELDRWRPQLILLDFRLPGMDGLQALQQLRKVAVDARVILMTAHGNLNLAVEALGQGVFDYLPKPFDLDDALRVVTQALAQHDPAPAAAQSPPAASDELLGQSRPMQDVFRQIALVAPLDVPVLITGESGVGKELVARAIHRFSQRHAAAFVPVCVPALSENVLESELFGHVRGAFTGAEWSRPGLLDQAHGGTAFLDEIGDIPVPQQVKLLRVLEDRRIVPVGGNESHPSDFRLIAATHQKLESLVSSGRFREDLLYRLNVYRIEIPPLRKRPEDIPVLVERFLSQVAGGRPLRLSTETLAELQGRDWPGNVRQLRSAVQHAAVVCRGDLITPHCLPAARFNSPESSPDDPFELTSRLTSWAEAELPGIDPARGILLHDRFLSRCEPPVLAAALRAASGNRKAAAELLGLHRETLRKRLARYGLMGDGPHGGEGE